MALISRDGVEGKVCTRCDTFKPLSGFSPRREHGKPTGDGYQNICKRCRSNAELERYHASPEPIKAANRKRHYDKREQRLAAMRDYRDKNRDQIIAQKREHWHTNKDRTNEERRLDRLQNRETYKENNRIYRNNNKEKLNARMRLYRRNNPDKFRRYNREFYLRHPEKAFEQARKYRLRKAKAEGSHNQAQWEALKAHYKYTCLHCRRREPEITLTEDHVIPLSKGGSDWIDNIQPLCFSCNSSKNNRYIDYRPAWEAEHGGRTPDSPDGGTLRERRAPYVFGTYVPRRAWRRRQGLRPRQ